MGILDEHNRQHTYGNSMGPPTTVVGVSAQQSIDAQKRLAEGRAPSGPGRALTAEESLRYAFITGGFALASAGIGYAIGGPAAFVGGLFAVLAGILCFVFLVASLIGSAANGSLRKNWKPIAIAAFAGWLIGRIFWMSIYPVASWHLAVVAALLALAVQQVRAGRNKG